MNFFNLHDNVNLLTIIGAIALLILTFLIVGSYIKQMKVKKETAELTDESWDGIKEYKNDLPIGWAITFIVLLVWAIWYFLFGYPLNSYSQIGEYNGEVNAYNAKFNAKFANASKDTLLAMGQGVFLNECAPCHGINAQGINGKARNLKKWGNEEGILYTINHGSAGLKYMLGEMPAGMVTGDDAKAVAAYVAQDISSIKHTNHPELVAKGKELWPTCAACHGEDGKGLDGQSFDLTKYGSPQVVLEVLKKGKHGNIGIMPSFTDGRLTDIQKRAVAEYIKSLSK